MIEKTIKEEVTHQDIGGKTFLIEMEVTKDVVEYKAIRGNWACYNFMNRRSDFKELNCKLYYGKIGNLGYVVAEDEFK